MRVFAVPWVCPGGVVVYASADHEDESIAVGELLRGPRGTYRVVGAATHAGAHTGGLVLCSCPDGDSPRVGDVLEVVRS